MERPWHLAAERRDAHNTAVDVRAAADHRCGTIDLRTGRVCTLPERHPGSCRFVVPPAPGRLRSAAATGAARRPG